MPLTKEEEAFNAGLDSAIAYHEAIAKRYDTASRALYVGDDFDFKLDNRGVSLGSRATDHQYMINDLIHLRKLSPEEIKQRQEDEDAAEQRENN